jgi:hypothetical protein
MRSGLALGLATLSALALAAAVMAMPPPSPKLAQPAGDPTASAPAATVSLSSKKAGARPVTLKVQIVAPLKCGMPFGSPVVVSLPRTSLVPRAIAGAAVLVNGKQSAKVTVSASSVTVALPLPQGVTCDSITDGKESLTFTQAAKLGNAPKPGTYKIHVRRGADTYAASVTLS